MATVIAQSAWTGTRGVVDGCLPENWDEALDTVKKSCSCSSCQFSRIYSVKVSVRAVEWALKYFGEEADIFNCPLKDIVDLYLDS